MEKPLTIVVDPRSPDPRAIADAARVICSGGVAVIPTDTVYGVGVVSGDPKALEKLNRIKKRPDGKQFASLISSADEAFRLAASISPLAHRLMRRLWPGPLTIVLPSLSGGTVGLRVPGMALARELIGRSGGAMIVSSANVAGGAEPVTAEEAIAALGATPDVVIDAGPCVLKKPSTVVRADRSGYEVLREGAIPRAEIADLAYVQVLFVCTGNTCRSPMAEGLMKAELGSRLGADADDLRSLGFRVVSAGTSASRGCSASEEAVEAMREIGAYIGSHESSPVSLSLVDESDLVFVMTARHRDVMLEMCGADPGKVMLMDPGGLGISDPIGGGMGTYRRTRDALRSAIVRRADEVIGARK